MRQIGRVTALDNAKIILTLRRTPARSPENSMHRAKKLITVGSLMLMLCASLSITFSATQSSAADIATKIKFKSEATSTEFDMLGDKQRGSIINGTRTETKLTVSPDGMSVKIESGTTLIGFLNLTRPDEIKLEDGGKKDMFVLKKEPDGHYKLKTASGDTSTR